MFVFTELMIGDKIVYCILAILIGIFIFAKLHSICNSESKHICNTEKFEASEKDIKFVIQAIDDVIYCESNTCNNDKVSDYVKFKKLLGNKYDLDTYLNLLTKRKSKSSSLTQDDVKMIIKDVKTIEKFATVPTDTKSDCTQALKEYIASCNAKDEKYQSDYKTWQTITFPAWQAAQTAEKQKLLQQWQDGLKLRPNEIIWEGQFKACGGGYGGCCNEAPEWQKKCECAGISSGCNQCFGRIKYD